VGLLLPAVQAAREAGRKSTCKNNLKQMGLALHNYHDIHGAFPLGVCGSQTSRFSDDGYGWAVSLLPQLEEQPLYDRIDPTGEPGVFTLTWQRTQMIIPGGDTVLPVFRCPTSVLPSHVDVGVVFRMGYATSDYKGCNGTGDSGIFFKVLDGIMAQGGPYTRVRAADVTDGLSQTIAFGESAYYIEFRDWPIWMGGPATDEPVLFKTQPPSVINCAAKEKSLEGMRRSADDDCAFSWHDGGAFFAFADGSVHFLPEDIDIDTYYNMGTKNDGNVLLGY
jgi:hypothetical protein